MKLKMLSLVSAGVYFAIGVGVLGCNSKQQPLIRPVDTPINIGGGSIYVDFSKGQPPSCRQETCTAITKNKNQISTEGVVGAPPTLTLAPGWIIYLANRGTAGNPKLAAVKVCSDPACSFAPGDPDKVYLIAARSDTRWGNVNGQMRFHDKECDGDSGNNEDGRCDFFLHVTIDNPRGTAVVRQAECRDSTGAGHCGIGIGTQ
jgi:hypothetical protein